MQNPRGPPLPKFVNSVSGIRDDLFGYHREHTDPHSRFSERAPAFKPCQLDVNRAFLCGGCSVTSSARNTSIISSMLGPHTVCAAAAPVVSRAQRAFVQRL